MFSSPEEVFEKEKKYIMQTYKRPRIVIREGKGTVVKDSFGKEYIQSHRWSLQRSYLR